VNKTVSIVIPVLNERENLKVLLPYLIRPGYGGCNVHI